MKNILLFTGVLGGTMLLIVGLVAIQQGARGGWYYVAAAVGAFALALAPGRRLKDAFFPDRPNV
ncbi:MAG: hypothetical protein WC700_03340 [Gemmatimonadaceae bacterium]|jgi:Na+/proline symporter